MSVPPRMRVVSNPPNPYQTEHVEWLDGAPEITPQVFEEEAHSIIAHNDSPDIGFDFSINPYRGCFHACAYCYARRTHQYLGYGAGTDFESKLVAKINAAELLRTALLKPSWRGEPIVFSGVTDCYQPLEATYELTRKCLQVCAEFKNPVGIITKGALIRRDIDVLKELHSFGGVTVFSSIAFINDENSRKIEPGAPRPSLRFRVMKELTDAGIPVGVGIAPVIVGLNDHEIPAILEKAYECGARRAFLTVVRLPQEVAPVFIERVNHEFPSKSLKILNQIKDVKNGALNRSEFGKRMKGEGSRWEAVEWLFSSTCQKLGMNLPAEKGRCELNSSQFARPTKQLSFNLA